MKKNIKDIFKLLVVFLFFAGFAQLAFAATGTIDSTNKYAWSNNAGWINFGSTYGNVQITDTAITGYIWNDNYGWINMSPTNSGVSNTTSGVLSGYAWGEELGWINFSGVTIDCSGKFTGSATGDVIGTLSFSCTNCNVTTGWRPSSGCGGGGPSVTCSTDISCGNSSYTGSLSCQDGNVYQNYITYTCHNPGLTTSYCTNSTEPKLKTTCTSSEVCDGGSCVPKATVVCSANSDCGVTGYIDSPVCQNGDVYQNYITYVCANPGLATSSCSNSTELKLKATCPSGQVCQGGVCVEQLFTHYACLEQKCVLVDGKDDNRCSTNSDCEIKKHNTCNASFQCVSVEGEGFNACASDNDCKQTHTECSNNQCLVIDGLGVSQCSTNADCQTAKHNECNSQQQCVLIDGSGSDQCQTNSDCAGGTGGLPEIRHTKCNDQKQCVYTSGAGNDECQLDKDCVPPEPIKIIENLGVAIQNTIEETIEKPVETVKTVAQETKKIIETPEGSVVTKTISTAGAVVTTVSVASAIVFSPFEIILILLRASGIFLSIFGIRKKIKPWGVVYDSVTKQPLDPAYVTLKDSNGKTVASAITDLDGRYGFLVEPGIYQLSAGKTNYVFPSQKLFGKVNDEFYKDLYFGGNVQITQKGEAIIKNIPMDSLKFDWNEFAKKDKKVMKFYSKFDKVLRRVVDWSFIIGFFIAIISYFAAPYPYNLIILIVYLLLLSLRFVNIKQRVYGGVSEKLTGNPLSFAVLRIIMPETNVEVAHKVADQLGRYYCLVPPGRYYVKIEKKNEDGSYSLVYTSPIVNASRKGIIKNNFEV